jgi:hypothetical protein
VRRSALSHPVPCAIGLINLFSPPPKLSSKKNILKPFFKFENLKVKRDSKMYETDFTKLSEEEKKQLRENLNRLYGGLIQEIKAEVVKAIKRGDILSVLYLKENVEIIISTALANLPDNQYFDLQATAENSKGETIQ